MSVEKFYMLSALAVAPKILNRNAFFKLKFLDVVRLKTGKIYSTHFKFGDKILTSDRFLARSLSNSSIS